MRTSRVGSWTVRRRRIDASRNVDAPPRSRDGLTLLELMAALIILGILLALVRPVVNGVTSKWRLRASAHQVESVVQWAQNAAAVRGEAVQILYDVPDGSYWVRSRDETYALHRLPGEIRFASVRFGEIEVTRDIAACGVFPDGTLDSHEVILQATDDVRVRLTFDRLTGEPTYEEGSF